MQSLLLAEQKSGERSNAELERLQEAQDELHSTYMEQMLDPETNYPTREGIAYLLEKLGCIRRNDFFLE